MFNTNFLKNLAPTTIDEILTAQIDDLIVRRNVSDSALFRTCILTVITNGEREPWESIENFNDVATEAFKAYHTARNARTTADTDAE